jgi:hypothetical protein
MDDQCSVPCRERNFHVVFELLIAMSVYCTVFCDVNLLVLFKFTDVSEERSVSVIKAEV